MNTVKELRERAGMQQKELAILIGVSQPTVSEWEHGKKDPSGDRLKRLSEVFCCEPGEILGYPKEKENRLDADVMDIREQLRRDPNTRILFKAAQKASPEHIRAAAAMLQALAGGDADDL